MRRRFPRGHDLGFEGGRLPSAGGIRKWWGASPQRSGELWGSSLAEGVHLGGLWALRVEVVDLAPPGALAELEEAGALGIAAVALDDPAAWQLRLA